MSNDTLIDAASNALANFIKKLIPNVVLGMGKINDINEKSGTMRLNLFGVYSNNIPDATAVTVKKVLESKYAGVVGELVQEIVTDAVLHGRNPTEDVKNQLSNKGYKATTGNASDDIALADSVQIVSRVVYNETPLSGNYLREAKDNSDMQSGTSFSIPFNYNKEAYTSVPDPTSSYGGKTVKDRNGKDITVSDITGSTKTNSGLEGGFCFVVDVSLMNIESSKVIDAIGGSKDRSNLFAYMKMRAGATGFFKDFLLNLKEIDKTVQRETSDSLSDRLLASMMRKGGLLSPMALSDISEAKYFLLVLEQCDIDSLKSQHGFDIRKPATLSLLFKQFNILSLVVVDGMRKNITMYDSDNPLKSSIFNYDKGGSTDQMASLFAALARK